MSGVEVVGIVLAVDRDDTLSGGGDDELDIIARRFTTLGFDVQAVSLHIDGQYRVEVLS